MKVVLALILVVSVPYLLLHHVYLALQRTVAGVTRAGVSIVVADYNENYDRYHKRLQVSSHPTAHPSGCGGRHSNTRRACVCRGMDEAEGDSASVVSERPVHVVYSSEDSDYMEWQARYDYFWFEKVGWKNAKLTRLLAASEPPKSISVPTHVAPPYNWTDDVYKAYNKPLSIMHWFKHAKPTDDIVIVVDPDCMFLKPFDMHELVSEGKPIAMKALYSFDYRFRDRYIVDRYSILGNFTCTQPDPIAVPVIIHRNDLERLAPLWLKWTELIRNDTEDGELKWDPEWKKVSFSWTAEMFGYVLAACELGLRHDIWPDLQAIPGQNATDLRSHPIIHYHTPVWAGGHKWVKYPKDAATNFIWPLDKVWYGASTPLVDKTFFSGMYEASRSLYGLPDDDFVWRGSLTETMKQIVRRNVHHRGCYRASRSDTDAVLVNSVSHGVLPCAESCVNRNMSFAAFSRGHLCHCASSVDRTGAARIDDADAGRACSAVCKDGDRCGAADSDAYMDVYEYVSPPPFADSDVELVGCFPDSTARRDLPLLKKLAAKSPGECLRLCVDADHPYAGMQMSQECWCGKQPPGRHGPAFEGASIAAECKFQCSNGMQCGGWSRNSVYKLKA